VTDLKTANLLLSQAIQALESPEHEADVAESEAIRTRLMDLDAAIGARIQAKLDAHRLIVDSWGMSDVVAPRKLEEPDEPIVQISDPLEVFDAPMGISVAAWEAHRESREGDTADG
jgi:hypothetical protein